MICYCKYTLLILPRCPHQQIMPIRHRFAAIHRTTSIDGRRQHTNCPHWSSINYNKNKWTRQHDDVIKWKHFPRHWPFVRGIHQSPLNSPGKGMWRGALVFSLICTWIYGCVNKRKVSDLRRHGTHYDVTVAIGHTQRVEPWYQECFVTNVVRDA